MDVWRLSTRRSGTRRFPHITRQEMFAERKAFDIRRWSKLARALPVRRSAARPQIGATPRGPGSGSGVPEPDPYRPRRWAVAVCPTGGVKGDLGSGLGAGTACFLYPWARFASGPPGARRGRPGARTWTGTACVHFLFPLSRPAAGRARRVQNAPSAFGGDRRVRSVWQQKTRSPV